MIRHLFVATAALALMTGAALAQTSSSTTTTSTTLAPAVVPGGISSSSSQQTTDSNGVTTDKSQTYTSGTTVSPAGDVSTTRKSTETTTVR